MRFVRHLLAITAFILFYDPAQGQTREMLFSRDSVKLHAELKQMLQKDQKYRTLKKITDRQAQTAIDDSNTVRMIEIIGTYGFPSMQRFNVRKKDIIIPHLILVHSSEKYSDTLKGIVETEYLARRMEQGEYVHVMWHLNGRKTSSSEEGGKTRRKKKVVKLRLNTDD